MNDLEKAGRLLRLLGWISLILFAMILAGLAIVALRKGLPSDQLIPLLIFCLLAVALPVLYLTTGTAIKRGKQWGKVTGAIIAGISLLSIPIGTIFGAAVLFYLLKGWDESAGSER